MTHRSGRRLPPPMREARERVPRGRARARPRVDTPRASRPRAAPKAKSSPIDVALLGARRRASVAAADLGHARRRRLLRLGLPGGAPARRRLRAPQSLDARRARRCFCTRSIRTASRTCAAPTRTTSTSTATSATSRSRCRANAAYAEVHGFMVPATWPPSPENEARLAALRRSARRARAAGGGERRPVRVPGRPVLRRRASGVEQPDAARGAARARRAARATLGWIDFHTGLGPCGPRREDLRGTATIAADCRAGAGVVGRRRHVVPRRLVDVGAADRRQLQRGVRRMPGRRVRGHRARVRHAAGDDGAAGAARRPVARAIIPTRRPSVRARDQARRCATRSTRTPTTGSAWSTRRRAPRAFAGVQRRRASRARA